MKTFLKYVGIVIKAIAQFLDFPYASQITVAVVAVFIGVFYHGWIGILLLVWAILLFVNAYKPKAKAINIPPQV